MRITTLLKTFSPFLVLLAMVGCRQAPQRSETFSEPSMQRNLNISFPADVSSLNPRIGVDYPSAFAIKMLFEGLMHIDLSGKVAPGIAEHYEISEDKKTYTFHLRDSKWSNGDPLTAYDFEYSWKKAIDPNVETLGVHNFFLLKNAQRVIEGTLPISSVGIHAPDEKTLIVELQHPTPYFLEMLATPSFFPVHEKTEKRNENWANLDGEDFVCNGPFHLQRRRIENEIVVEKNSLYWDSSSVKLPGINIVIIKDAMTQLLMYEKNELDWLGNPLTRIPLDAIAQLKKAGKIKIFKTLGLHWFYVNVESYPFQNKKMRRAFALAVNRKAITDNLLQSDETPALGILPHSLSTQENPFIQDNDLAEARGLFNEALAELGITKEELPTITINASTYLDYRKVAEAVQQQWKEAFEIDLTLEVNDWRFHLTKLQKGNYQIGGTAWQSWIRDPIYTMQSFRDKLDGINMSRWEDKEYKSLLTATEEEIDPDARRALFNRAETILMEELPVIPIYLRTLAYSHNEDLKDVYISELYEVDFRWAYFGDSLNEQPKTDH